MTTEASPVATEAASLPIPRAADDARPWKRVSPGVWWRTVREFQFRQVLHLLRRRFFPLFQTVRVVPGPKKLRPLAGPVPFGEWQRAEARSAVETRTFLFLNQAGRSAVSIPWNSEDHSLPWLYNLNYCDFLNLDLTRPSDQALLRNALSIAVDWVERNPLGSEVGWMPYPLSVRIVNWLKFLVRNAVRLRSASEGAGLETMIQSLADQAATLRGRLEFDLRANHLLKNIKALIFSGALIESIVSDDWWQTGEHLLGGQLEEQVLADGGHFERSPMYHAQVLEDLVDIRSLTKAIARPLVCAELLDRKIAAMREFLGAILHPDGEIPLFNDATLSGARPACELIGTAADGGQSTAIDGRRTVRVFPQTGYAVLRDRGTQSALIFDGAPVGPNFNPGHAHADVLSYELSLHGQRVVVDTGVSTYEAGPERRYERSTAAHNTVRIDGENQAEVWASFRVGRRPPVGALTAGETAGFQFVRARHFGYRHRGVSHARAVARTPEGVWLVVDWLYGRGSHRAQSFVHFHPSIPIQCLDARAGGVNFYVGSRCYRFATFGGGTLERFTTWYAPEFGVRRPRASLRWTWLGALPVMLTYAFMPADVAPPRVEQLAGHGVVSIDGVRIAVRY
jgi:uncharacterized heparinase superfamily protein